MTFQDFQTELQNKNSSLAQSLETVQKAIRARPEKERTKNWADCLDKLTTMSEGEYDAVREGVFNGLSDMIADYHAPGELFAEKKTREAMEQVFKALELDKRRMRVPHFHDSGNEKAGQALKEDMLDYSAQLLAFSKLNDEVSPADMFRALGDIPRWKKHRSLKNMMENGRNTRDLLSKGNTALFLRELVEERKKVSENTRTFKDCSDEIAGQYRAKEISYAELEQRMKVLRELTSGAVSGVENPAERSRRQDEAPVYMPDFEKKLKELGIGTRQTVKTTAQDVYNTLTKDYKAGKINYTDYEAHLKTMRELTGGNKHAKIDIATIDNAIKARLEQSMGPVDREIRKQLNDTFGGKIGARLKVIYDLYGKTPTPYERSFREAYTKEQFALLDTFEEKEGEPRLRVVADSLISDAEFTSLSVAVTQAFPELGGKYIVKNKTTGKFENVIKNPTAEDASAVHTLYTTDVWRDSAGARARMGDYIEPVVAPARRKAADALRQFNAGDGDPKELGKIIGMGLHNMIETAFILDASSREILSDNALDGIIIGTLAEICEKNPALKQAASEYATKDELDKAKGMKSIYDIIRATVDAKERLKESVENNTPLPETERRACIELMLQERVLTISARHEFAQNPQIAEAQAKLDVEVNEKLFNAETQEEKSYLGVWITSANFALYGLPSYVKTLGTMGTDFARDMLDMAMPNREAFFKLSDAEILKAFDAKIDSRDDPFRNPEYTKYNENAALAKAMRERQRQAPQADGAAKTL